jgi:hypothetical protein
MLLLQQAFSPITAYTRFTLTRFIAIIKYVGITPVVQVQSTFVVIALAYFQCQQVNMHVQY